MAGSAASSVAGGLVAVAGSAARPMAGGAVMPVLGSMPRSAAGRSVAGSVA